MPYPKRYIGRKGKAWIKARRKTGKFFYENQIERCENCYSTFGTGNAHRFKRIDIKTEEELLTTVLLCTACHFKADNEMSREEMKEFLDSIIAGRDERYWQPC